MSALVERDGRATAGARSRASTGRMRAGRRWTGQAFPSLLAAAALAALGGGPIVPPTRINDLQLDQNKQQRKR